MPLNPSELARLEQEAAYLNAVIYGEESRHFSKAFKERKLAELRSVEKQLGIEGRKYNA